jgi:alanine dehydrogenase
VLLLSRTEVRQALPKQQAIALMADAMRRYSGGQVSQPLRTILRPPTETGLLGTMPCHVAPAPDNGFPVAGFGLKAMVLKPENPARGLDLHIGLVVVFDPDDGRPLAVMDAGAVTAIRTAAVSAVATDTLANPGACDLAILGCGVQARAHLELMAEVRKLRTVRVWNRTRANAESLRDWAAHWLDTPVLVMDSVSAALDGADLICTTLATREPVVQVEQLAPGAHLNVVGASFPDARELTSVAIAAATVFVDSRESARTESADLRMPMAEGEIGPEHVVAELGEVLLGRHPGRTRADEITAYKSLGLAVQDILSGFVIASNAAAQGLGTHIDLD